MLSGSATEAARGHSARRTEPTERPSEVPTTKRARLPAKEGGRVASCGAPLPRGRQRATDVNLLPRASSPMGSGARYGRAARRALLSPSPCTQAAARLGSRGPGVQGWSVLLARGRQWAPQLVVSEAREDVAFGMGACIYRRAWYSIWRSAGQRNHRGCTSQGIACLRAAAVRVLVPLLRACLLHHTLRLCRKHKVAHPVARQRALSGGSSQRHRSCPELRPAARRPRVNQSARLVRAGRPHRPVYLRPSARGPGAAVSRGHL